MVAGSCFNKHLPNIHGLHSGTWYHGAQRHVALPAFHSLAYSYLLWGCRCGC